MKKRLLVCLVLALCCIPVPVYADGSGKTFHFELGGGDWYHGSVAPGEFLEDTVIVENETDYPLKFRLVKTENLHESRLYGVMMYSMGGSGFVSLRDMASDWIEVGVGEAVELPVVGYLPETLGNEWQGGELRVRFHFEGRLLEGTDTPDEPDTPVKPENPDEPDTPAKPEEPALPDVPEPLWDTDINGEPDGYCKSIDQEPSEVTVTVDKTGKGVAVKAVKTGDTADIFVYGILLAESTGVIIVYGRRCRHGGKDEAGMDSHT